MKYVKYSDAEQNVFIIFLCILALYISTYYKIDFVLRASFVWWYINFFLGYLMPNQSFRSTISGIFS